MKDRLNILFLTARYPYPVIGGDRLKPYKILSYLGKKHNVWLVSFYQGSKIPSEYLDAISDLGVQVNIITLNPFLAGLNAILKNSKLPLEIGYYHHKKFKNIVDNILNKNNINLGISFFMRTAEYLKSKPIKKILMAEDCRTLYQKRSYENSTKLYQKIIRLKEYKKLIKYEPEIVNYFDTTTLVTEEDIIAMKKNNPLADYSLLSNGTDIEKFIPNNKKNDEKIILFSGKLDVWANQLMSQKIIKELFPEIKKQVPEAKLIIVGANPPKHLLSQKTKDIDIIANVPNMIEYLQKASLFLHPHNGGSGIQNKLLEAMSCGCPVVTTPTGNQGINGINGQHLMIGKNTKELIEKSITILKNKDLADKISHHSRELIVKTHSWDVIYKQLDLIIEKVMKIKR